MYFRFKAGFLSMILKEVSFSELILGHYPSHTINPISHETELHSLCAILT